MDKELDINNILPVDKVCALCANNSITNYKQKFKDFESGCVIGWIGSLIKNIFEFYGTSNFVADCVIAQAAITINSKYPYMEIGFFGMFYFRWINGEFGTTAPTTPIILQKLNIAAYGLKKADKEKYSIIDVYKMQNILELNSNWLFKDKHPKAAENAYFKKINGKALLTDFFLCELLAPGTIAENTMPVLLEHFYKWLERKAKQTGKKIIYEKENKI